MKSYNINYKLLDKLLNNLPFLKYLYISKYNKNYLSLKNKYHNINIY